ncbi:MAG: SDR family NAD(P)-dependent oxidoreductase [Planctomycetota bacterium]|jgi:NAD(P)-dependent dehydrogenase (short-subunit alcohol dehydrogenase family)
MTGSLKGKTALVTGGGTGVGLGCTRRLLEEGARVTMAARRVDVLEQTAEHLRSEIAGAQVGACRCDIPVEDDLAAAVQSAAGPDGHLDIAVANAGSGAPGPIMTLRSEDWRFANELNILGTALTIKQAALAMKDRGGSIVAISSVEAFKVARYMAPYTVTKAALEALVVCAALELAPFGIRVNCIRPGYVPTEGTALAFSDEEAERLIDITPLGRCESAEEIGDAVVYFSAEPGTWVTGQVLAVDGGMGIPEGVSLENLCRRLYGDEVMDRCTGPSVE